MGSKKAHVMVTPYPAQGHIGPLMKLAYKIAKNGIKVTFVIADYMHRKIMPSIPPESQHLIPINLVPISTDYNDAKDAFELIKSVFCTMPCNLLRLIEKINQENEDEQVSCIVTDTSAWWSVEVAKNLGIKVATVVAFGVGNLAFDFHVPNLIDSGIIDVDGISLKDELIYVSKKTLPWTTKELSWSMPRLGPTGEKFVFQHVVRRCLETTKNSDWILVNSFYELEKWAYDLIPKATPIGPLIINDDQEPFLGNVWQEDSTCLNWLDQWPKNSVIYAAFGSIATCNRQQFHELAHALELMGQPFFWVVRSDFSQATELFPQGFRERTAKFGKIVAWAPQEKVLSHPSIACFFSHCGWNSTIEGVSKGVPILCWPNCFDQMHNSRLICETWKVGLRVLADENGIITREEIKSKIENLVCNQEIKGSALKWMEVASKNVAEGGPSFINFMAFIQDILL